MTEALRVENLSKSFRNFSLNNVSFTVPQGQVVGLIGENGSGKSTTIRCILGQDIPNAGTVSIYGKNALRDIETHRLVGVSTDSHCFPEQFNPRQISSVMKDIFEDWQEDYFFSFLKRYDVPLDRKVRQLSKGMRVKLAMAAAISHKASLLLLDEATAGLDPVVREDILELLQEFMEDETHAILMTSHITSDIERIADLILYIQDGTILFELRKDELEGYGLAQLRQEEVEFIDPSLVIARRKLPVHTEVLVRDRTEFEKRYPDYTINPATLDEIIVMLSKGEKNV